MRTLYPLLIAFLIANAVYADSSTARSKLALTGTDLDAKGSASGRFGPKSSSFRVDGSKLNPLTAYTVEVGGIEVGSFTTNKGGSGRVDFSAPLKKNKQLLDFDPRGNSVDIKFSGASVLAGVYSGVGEDDSASVNESAALDSKVPGSSATATFSRSASGNTKFTVSVKKVNDTETILFVDGQEKGRVTPNRGTAAFRFAKGKIPTGSQLLDFDPRGQGVDLVQSGTLIFSGRMLADGLGASLAVPDVSLIAIPATAAASNGKATAKYRVDSKARRSFSVEVEDVPVGSYDLFSNNVLVGQIVVTSDSGDTSGEIEFSNRNEGDELPLTFDPLGALISIRSGAVTFFEGAFDPSASEGVPGPESPVTIDEQLASTGADPNASGDAKYEVDSKGEHKFSVSIEDVAVGSYQLFVGGEKRGTFKAVDLGGGDIEGEIEFASNNDSGELLLDFDPRNRLIEVVDSMGTVLFSHVLGSGNQGGTTVQPVTLDLPLFAEPGVVGTATLHFQRKDDGEEKLKIVMDGAQAGTYDVAIGGTKIGTITVTGSSETEGEAEFESEPESGDQTLGVAVLGKDLVISQSSVVKFSRTIPAN